MTYAVLAVLMALQIGQYRTDTVRYANFSSETASIATTNLCSRGCRAGVYQVDVAAWQGEPCNNPGAGRGAGQVAITVKYGGKNIWPPVHKVLTLQIEPVRTAHVEDSWLIESDGSPITLQTQVMSCTVGTVRYSLRTRVYRVGPRPPKERLLPKELQK